MKEKDIYYSAIEANIANKNRIYRKAVNSRQRPGLKRGLAVAAASTSKHPPRSAPPKQTRKRPWKRR